VTWDTVVFSLRQEKEAYDDVSPDHLRRKIGLLRISHETIYRYIWADKRHGGQLYTHLRGACKQRRKRYGRYDSRGRVAGKRPITARPAVVETRAQVGHWEADTLLGPGRPCVLSLVERKTGMWCWGSCGRARPRR